MSHLLYLMFRCDEKFENFGRVGLNTADVPAVAKACVATAAHCTTLRTVAGSLGAWPAGRPCQSATANARAGHR